MLFEIKNPNYSRQSLKKLAKAIIARHDSAEPICQILDKTKIEKHYIFPKIDIATLQKSAQ